MLVLTRKINESLLIGDEVVITVVDVQGAKVRLGIEAPKEISIARSEIVRKALPVQDISQPDTV